MPHSSKVIKVINTKEELEKGFNSITQLGKVQVLHLLQPETKPLHKQQHQDHFSIKEIEIFQHAVIRIQEFKVKRLIVILQRETAYQAKQKSMLKS